MISNYYILHQVVHDLNAELHSKVFTRAYSVHPGELQLVFDDDIVVTVILNPAHSTIYRNTSTQPHSPKRNSISFFRELENKPVRKIEIDVSDKKIGFSFDEYLLVLRFFDSPNAVLYKNGEPVSTFKKEVELRTRKNVRPQSLLRQTMPMLGKYLEKEFYIRYPEAKQSDELLLYSAAKYDKLLRQSDSATFYGDPLLLSPIRLESIHTGGISTYTSEGIEQILRQRRRTQSFNERKKIIAAKLEAILGRTAKALADAEHGIEESSRAERYRAIGEAIQSKAYEIEKGTEKISFEFESKEDSAVLDPKLNAYENAANYFDKARKSDEAKKGRIKRLEELRKNRTLISSLVERLSTFSTLKELDTFEEELKRQSFLLEKSDESAERSGDLLDRFRRFRVAGGFEVLAGKNAKQNDELTMKVAAKEDLWFHARHVAGSHVVLRSAGKKDIPHQAIMQAASIAAYYSDAKTQKVAPVAFTHRKYVRKRKGAAVGEVVVDREEVVMVEPVLV
ncbi:MAG TPA: NFACT RNA binding domain-containing protein [Candidatus Kapabacteria bacterium]|nr:NFACT RNA binding domain-containing protein [Candidatus Kapabacteria bacterium]